jgi:hypothetical protein
VVPRVKLDGYETTFFKAVHPLNAELPILLTFTRFMYVSPMHPLKADSEMVVILFVKYTFVRDVTPLNMNGGIVLVSIKKLLHPVNAPVPTLVIVFPDDIVIDVIVVLPLKAFVPILVKLASVTLVSAVDKLENNPGALEVFGITQLGVVPCIVRVALIPKKALELTVIVGVPVYSRLIVARLEQLLKALVPKVVTLDGIVTEVIAVDP